MSFATKAILLILSVIWGCVAILKYVPDPELQLGLMLSTAVIGIYLSIKMEC